MAQPTYPILIIVMGVCGTGKSTLGKALADSLDLPMIDADDLHPKANIAKMSAGNPLNDDDRWPWLRIVRSTAERHIRQQQDNAKQGNVVGAVVGCSALRVAYRDILRGKDTRNDEHVSIPIEVEDGVHPNETDSTPTSPIRTFFVFIDGPYSLMSERMQHRKNHFMKTAMLDSQLATLESPAEFGEENVVVVSLADTTQVQTEKAIEGLRQLGALVP